MVHAVDPQYCCTTYTVLRYKTKHNRERIVMFVLSRPYLRFFYLLLRDYLRDFVVGLVQFNRLVTRLF